MIPRICEIADGFHNLITPGIGPFIVGSPKGITVHYTASGTLKSALNSEATTKLGYHLIIDRDGSIVQSCYLDQRVNHAGKASWLNTSPNSHHIAIALVSWGLLNGKGETYTGSQIAADEIRERNGHKWHSATSAQELSLIRLLTWLMAKGINRKQICGHDECCIPKGRKVDPGSVLSFTMEEFRSELYPKNIGTGGGG